MKRVFFLLTFLIAAIATVYAQPASPESAPLKVKPIFYFGSETGINNFNGLMGLRLDSRISRRMMVGAGIGVGSWGLKSSVGAYYMTEKNWCPMLGFSYSTGVDSLGIRTEVNNVQQSISLKLNPTLNINVGVQKNWFTKKGNRMFWDLGYSLLLTGPLIKVRTPKVILDYGVRKAFEIISPGGFIIGFGYAFKL